VSLHHYVALPGVDGNRSFLIFRNGREHYRDTGSPSYFDDYTVSFRTREGGVARWRLEAKCRMANTLKL
jgi:hypothetical protein